jgi:hypothetical protein
LDEALIFWHLYEAVSDSDSGVVVDFTQAVNDSLTKAAFIPCRRTRWIAQADRQMNSLTGGEGGVVPRMGFGILMGETTVTRVGWPVGRERKGDTVLDSHKNFKAVLFMNKQQ